MTLLQQPSFFVQRIELGDWIGAPTGGEEWVRDTRKEELTPVLFQSSSRPGVDAFYWGRVLRI